MGQNSAGAMGNVPDGALEGRSEHFSAGGELPARS